MHDEDLFRATLVAFYGEKPPDLANLIRSCQEIVGQCLSGKFKARDIEQVHATIVGLEGWRQAGAILNKNFKEIRGEGRTIDFEGMLNYLNSAGTDIWPIGIQIGGFVPWKAFPFTSNDLHPHFRSFSIQNKIAVAMGWPVRGAEYSETLFQLRRELETFGVLHKYHKRPDSVDNDLFFVLGRVRRDADDDQTIRQAEETLRTYLAACEHVPIFSSIDKEHLSIVMYGDEELPLATSRPYPITDPQLNGLLPGEPAQ